MGLELEKTYGLFFTNIPQEEVPYPSKDLEDFEMIKNSFNQVLLYNKQGKYYRFINNDQNTYISRDQMLSPWKKYNPNE